MDKGGGTIDSLPLNAPRVKKIIWIVAVTLVLTGGTWLVRESKAISDKTIKIGGAFGQSGICAEFGEGELKGATLAIEEVNASGGVLGKPLELISEDTHCEN